MSTESLVKSIFDMWVGFQIEVCRTFLDVVCLSANIINISAVLLISLSVIYILSWLFVYFRRQPDQDLPAVSPSPNKEEEEEEEEPATTTYYCDWCGIGFDNRWFKIEGRYTVCQQCLPPSAVTPHCGKMSIEHAVSTSHLPRVSRSRLRINAELLTKAFCEANLSTHPPNHC